MSIFDFFSSKRSELIAAPRAATDLQRDMAATAVQSCHVSIRERTEDGVRAIVTGAALGSFVFDHQEAARRILKRWPDLEPKQVTQLVRYLDSRVRLTARSKGPIPERSKSSWVSRWVGNSPDNTFFSR